MGHIVNPWFFYLAGVSDCLSFAFVLIGLLALIVAIVLTITSFVSLDDFDEDSAKVKLGIAKKFAIIATVGLIAGSFIPGESTVYRMMVADVATYDNAETVVESIKSAADYIVEAFGKIE